MLVSLLASAALIVGDPDAAIATAPETPVALDVAAAPAAPSVQGAAQEGAVQGLTTDEQIDRWLAAREPAAPHWVDGARPGDDRLPHGEVSVGVGSGGYRDYGAAVSLPIGETGRLELSWRQVENGYRGYGYEYGYGDGYGAGWGHPPEQIPDYLRRGRGLGPAAELEWRLAQPDAPGQWPHEAGPRPLP